jgi:hypothetical protein
MTKVRTCIKCSCSGAESLFVKRGKNTYRNVCKECDSKRKKNKPRKYTRKFNHNIEYDFSLFTYLAGEFWVSHNKLSHIYVSNMGRVFRSQTTYFRKHRDKDVTSPLPAKFLVGDVLSAKGYSRVNLGSKVDFVHRIVASHFIPNPQNKPQVNHINGIKTDNRVLNLEWCTNYENRQHAVANGLHAKGEKLSKFSDEDIIDMFNLSHLAFQKDIGKCFGVGQRTVSKILKSKRLKELLGY